MPTGIYKRTRPPWNKGKKHPKISGFRNHMWRGMKASYHSIHEWVVRNKGTPDKCKRCRKSGLKGREIHWANKDHKYRRILSDWIRLCSKCHGIYDNENGLRFNNRGYHGMFINK